jgi:hypothetical protein
VLPPPVSPKVNPRSALSITLQLLRSCLFSGLDFTSPHRGCQGLSDISRRII